MTSDVETILRHTRSQLRELGETIQNLVTDYPGIFDDTEIQKRLVDLGVSSPTVYHCFNALP